MRVFLDAQGQLTLLSVRRPSSSVPLPSTQTSCSYFKRGLNWKGTPRSNICLEKQKSDEPYDTNYIKVLPKVYRNHKTPAFIIAYLQILDYFTDILTLVSNEMSPVIKRLVLCPFEKQTCANQPAQMHSLISTVTVVGRSIDIIIL